MEDSSAANAAPQSETCICREIGAQLNAMFGIKSEAARDHLRNARIEMLKAVRSIIDERIEVLSRPQHKGTKVAVE